MFDGVRRRSAAVTGRVACLLVWALVGCLAMGQTATTVPQRVAQSKRYLAARGVQSTARSQAVSRRLTATLRTALRAAAQTSATVPQWEPLGPKTVQTAGFGLVSGRVAALAFDPSDTAGNTVFAGTTGGGLWRSQNAAAAAGSVMFTPLTDAVGALNGMQDASVTIGAVTVQPGGTGVVLAGTGDVNDALDSYYGAGLLRSTDNGATWNLIQGSSDGLWRFVGEGFAGFAWSTTNPQLVVAAVAQAYGGYLVNAPMPDASYQGLYYSTDAGATWALATISDGVNAPVQGATAGFAHPDGNGATGVVWNPVRHAFVAAVRYHGYYQSSDGVTWTRLTAQPGSGLTTMACPTNPGATGSTACPIFRGTLAVNPQTGDLFAWTVDATNQDQGLWQDVCAASSGTCSNQTIQFATRISTAALEVNGVGLGAATIMNGDYNLALAAVPSGQDTLLLAGANDLWRCSLAAGCVWRNTTNSTTCRSAAVGEYQHALAWNASNSLQVMVGNDSGLWRSTDAVAETGAACSTSDAGHFDNLNGGLGSLAEMESVSAVTSSPYTLLAGLGANGAAGVKSTAGPVDQWPQVLDGEGGPVAIDPTNATKWYVNNAAGVSIHQCAQTGDCTAADFGTTPVVTDADVSGDGYTMLEPAPFMVDPLDATQLLVGTCRVWRGPTDGSTWTSADALSGYLDGVTGASYCNGNAQIRTMAAMAVAGGGEVIYVGMRGSLDGGATLAGHVLSATYTPGGGAPVWQDLALNPVTNDNQAFNANGMGISSIYIDPHDATGNTVYVTVQGVREGAVKVRTIYQTTDGGAHWAFASLGLPWTAANSVVVDPQDANTVYVATDAGVFATQQIATCVTANSACWTAYGAGLPMAPVISLHAAPATVTPSVLVVGTFGRGAWQVPLMSAGTQTTTATVDPTALDFGTVAYGSPSTAQTVTVTNTGGIALGITSIAMTGDFSETDDCQSAAVNTDASCTISVVFTPTQQGSRTGQMTLNGNVAGGQMTVQLSGTGGAPGAVSLLPTRLDFGQVQINTTSNALAVTLENTGSTAATITSVTATAPFTLASNSCGSSVAANSSCQMTVEFAPTATGTAAGTLTVVSSAGTQTAVLTGTGEAAPTDTLSPTSLAFAATVIGQTSSTQTVSLTNTGGVALSSIAVQMSGAFTESSTCGTQLAAGSSCAISVAFVPTAVGAATGTVTVTDALRTQTVSLSGTGLKPPAIGVSPTALSFSTQAVGSTSAPLTLTVTNTGGAPMASLGFAVTGTAAAGFATGTTTCGTTLAAGASCTVPVMFTPTLVGSNTATLTVSSSTPGVAAVGVPLSGTATAASGLNVTPAQMTFTVATLGTASAAQTVTLTNTSTTAASGVTLTTAVPFSLTANTCAATLAAGGSCTVGVVFTPTVNGVAVGTLSIGSANLNAGAVQLTGAGGAAGTATLLPGTLTFATTGVGTVSTAQTATLTNTGAVALTNLALTASGGFQVKSTTCGTALATGASCTAALVFAPSAVGAATGTLTATSTDLPAALQVALNGTGYDFSVGTGSASQSVASGQTATFSMTLTPLGGVGASFTYSCGTLPAYAYCSFNPASTAVSAGSSGSVVVNVVTGHTLAAVRAPDEFGWGRPLALCGLLLAPWAWRRRQRALLALALLLVLGGGTTGCVAAGGGGSGTGGTSGSNTPAGTYTVTVTATSNGVSHAANFTLTVD